MQNCVFSLLVVLALVLTGCTGQSTQTEKDLYAMDTIIAIRIPDENSDQLFAECERMIRAYEAVLSRTDADSEVSRFNACEQGMPLGEELLQIVSLSLELSRATDGAFDVTAEPLTALWDITGEAPRVPDPQEIACALDAVGYQQLALEGDVLTKSAPAVHIDLGGVGKGYALGAITDYLREQGVEYGMVSFGGNIGLIGQKPDGADWKIGVKDPRDPDSIVGTLSLTGGYVAVSGDYERYFMADGVRYHHIFDPRTGYPANSGIQSVAVVCDDATLADALSTALFVMGYERALEFYHNGAYDFEAVFVTGDGIFTTDGLTDRFISK